MVSRIQTTQPKCCPLGIIFLRRSYLKQWYQLIIASTYCGKNAVPVFLGHPVYHIITLSLHWWTTEVLSIIVIKVITELSWNYCDLFNRDKLNLSSIMVYTIASPARVFYVIHTKFVLYCRLHSEWISYSQWRSYWSQWLLNLNHIKYSNGKGQWHRIDWLN